MSRLRPLLLSLAAACPLAAQCDLTWLPGVPTSGPNGSITSVLAMPNGDVFAGGTFTTADAATVNNIAQWNGTTWRALGSGADNTVQCLARLPNGELIAGGRFTAMGGVACSRIARWNGTSWSSLGTGLDGPVEALLVLANGDLVAAGSFVNAGAVPVHRIARWNGIAWSAIGPGLPTGTALTLAQHPNGDLYVGGEFSGPNSDGIQVWNGTQWQQLVGVPAFSAISVRDLAIQPNGTLVASGTIVINGLFETLGLWNGTSMQALPAPVTSGDRALLASPGGMLLGGSAILGQPSSLYRLVGGVWVPIAGAPPSVRAVAEDASGRIVVGTSTSGQPPRPSPVARFDGVAWQTLGAPVPPLPQAMLTLADGDVVVGGTFTSFRGQPAANIVRWNGLSWAPLGLGVDGRVRVLAQAPNGDVIAGGSFLNAGGAPASRIARWNGTAWATLGAGLPIEPTAIAVVPSGDVYVSAQSLGLRVFRNGQWTQLTVPQSLIAPQSLAVLADGTLALGGLFGSPLTGLALQTSTGFAIQPNAPIAIQRMLVGRDGTLYAASGVGLRSWNGTSWTVLPGGFTQTLALLPDGDLLAGIGSTQSMLSRITPTGATPFGAVQGALPTCLAVSGRGEILAGGPFTTVNGAASFGFTLAQPTCPAAATVVGSGCSGGAGPVTLAATSLPWAGGLFAGTATGMTNPSVALQLVGLQAATSALPGGAPGCSLLVNPIVADTLLPAGGTATAAFVVPDVPSLAGLTFRLQVVGIELGPTGIVRLTSTNALEATIGVL